MAMEQRRPPIGEHATLKINPPQESDEEKLRLLLDRFDVQANGDALLVKDRKSRTVITFDANGVTFSADQVTLTADTLGLQGSGALNLDASTTRLRAGLVNLESALTEAQGIFKAETVQANTMIANSYTGGAGNIR